MFLIQTISITGSIIFLVIVLTAVYRNKLQDAYALLWLLTGILLLAVSVFPGLLSLLAMLTGIQTPAFAVLLILLCGSFLILFQQTVVISGQQMRLRALAEETALLKEALESVKFNIPAGEKK